MFPHSAHLSVLICSDGTSRRNIGTALESLGEFRGPSGGSAVSQLLTGRGSAGDMGARWGTADAGGAAAADR